MWIKRKAYDEMIASIAARDKYLLELEQENLTILKQHRDDGVVLQKRIDDLSAELDKNIELFGKLFGKAESNEVILRIEDDLTTITPIVRWKDTTPEKLIEIGAMTDANHSKIATQVALMAIAGEAISDIMASFEEPVGDE